MNSRRFTFSPIRRDWNLAKENDVSCMWRQFTDKLTESSVEIGAIASKLVPSLSIHEHGVRIPFTYPFSSRSIEVLG